ncbi:MAG: DUF2147 domain-containing protein [Bacteroidota bacterium]|nr:DUF2147 domain-containing protein [Bacteroidota bacterium]
MIRIIVCLILAFPLLAKGQSKGDSIIGVWFNQEKTAKLQISNEDGAYFGKIVWLQAKHDKATLYTDKTNPDSSMHTDSLMGMTVMRHFTFGSKDTYRGGIIYDHMNGKEYKCNMVLIGGQFLMIVGYTGIPTMSRSMEWQRVKLRSNESTGL